MKVDYFYRVKRIKVVEARPLIEEEHYTRSISKAAACFGVFHINTGLQGVVAFQVPVSEAVRSCVWGPEHKDKVRELHRVAIRRPHPVNLTSWAIAQAIKMYLDVAPLTRGIISFADSTEGHHGGIYRALNAIDGGETQAVPMWRDTQTGSLHSARQCGKMITPEEAERRGWVKERRGVKRRFLWIVGDGHPSRRVLRKMLQGPWKGA